MGKDPTKQVNTKLFICILKINNMGQNENNLCYTVLMLYPQKN